MLPDLVLSVAGIFILIALLIFIPILYLAGVNWFAKLETGASDTADPNGITDVKASAGGFLVVMWFIIAIITGMKNDNRYICMSSNIF